MLGCGSIGARHARNLVALGVEVVVSDPNAQRTDALAGDIDVDVAPDRDAAVADIAIVATPSMQHSADAIWCVQRGMHTFVEKPVAASRNGLELATAAAAASDRVTMVACNLRFSAGYRVLREQLPGIGRIVSVVADFGWYLPAWRPQSDYTASYSARREMGGGVILDAAIHELDYVTDIAGPVVGTSGMWTASGSLAITVDDAAGILLRHQSGCISQIHVDYLRRTYTRTCTVVGAEGTLVWDLAEGSVTVRHSVDEERTSVSNLDLDRNAMYVDEMRHFLAAVAAGRNEVNTIGQAAVTTGIALHVLHIGAG